MVRPDIRSRPGDIWLSLYLIASWFATPVFWLVHWIRCRSGKDDPARGAERFGVCRSSRSSGQLTWVHAASVGETNSVLPLIERLTGQGHQVLLTTVTVTSAEIAKKALPEGALHQYAPYDTPRALNRFLDHWKPDLAVMVEAEIWPGILTLSSRRGIPIAVVNGRLSERSTRFWKRTGGFARSLFAQIDLCFAQSDADAVRYRDLGVHKVATPGNLKFDVVPPIAEAQDVAAFKKMLGGRKVFLAASTHPGEDGIVLDVYQALKPDLSDLLLIIAPRHPLRGEEISALVEERGLQAARRSRLQEPVDDTAVYIADTLGEMGLFYRVADAAFIGGSYAPVGGHNPVEAAGLDAAIISGPNVAKTRAVYQEFWRAGAAIRADTPQDLTNAVHHLLKDDAKRLILTAKARDVINHGQGALDRTLEGLKPYLDGQPAVRTAS